MVSCVSQNTWLQVRNSQPKTSVFASSWVQSIAGNPERSIQHCNNRYVDELNHACLYEFNGALYETGHSMFTDWVVSNDH